MKRKQKVIEREKRLLDRQIIHDDSVDNEQYDTDDIL